MLVCGNPHIVCTSSDELAIGQHCVQNRCNPSLDACASVSDMVQHPSCWKSQYSIVRHSTYAVRQVIFCVSSFDGLEALLPSGPPTYSFHARSPSSSFAAFCCFSCIAYLAGKAPLKAPFFRVHNPPAEPHVTLIGLPHFLLVNHYQGSSAFRSSPSYYNIATALIPPIRGLCFPNGLIWGKLTSKFRNGPLFWDASQFTDTSAQKQSDGTNAAGQRTKASKGWDGRCNLAMSGRMHKKCVLKCRACCISYQFVFTTTNKLCYAAGYLRTSQFDNYV